MVWCDPDDIRQGLNSDFEIQVSQYHLSIKKAIPVEKPDNRNHECFQIHKLVI
jgi:hypothetical protein